MGITFSALRSLEDHDLLPRENGAVLDIGSSNLYSATTEDIEGFVQRFGDKGTGPVREFADRLSFGSGYDPVAGGRNEAFVGELLERVGMKYVAFDIADGYRTTILDLNTAALPKSQCGQYDLVLNYGTTEHILNQLNCFRVIHDAVKVGGCIVHSLPAIGYVDHGYITYTGRCFFDMAGFNEYEIVDCWFDGPSGGNNVLASLESYQSYFPALGESLAALKESEQGRALREMMIPDVGINVIYRKTRDAPFGGALESSTSVGNIPNAVTGAYESTTSADTPVPQPSAVEQPDASLAERVAGRLQNNPLLYRAVRSVYRAFR